jgi:hypothetical protein
MTNIKYFAEIMIDAYQIGKLSKQALPKKHVQECHEHVFVCKSHSR